MNKMQKEVLLSHGLAFSCRQIPQRQGRTPDEFHQETVNFLKENPSVFEPFKPQITEASVQKSHAEALQVIERFCGPNWTLEEFGL